MKINQNITSIILILGLAVYAIALFGIIDIPLVLITAIIFMVYGLASVIAAIGSQRKAFLFFSTVVFLIGILLYVTNQYLFMNSKALLFPSGLFIIGSAFLMLFIDDSTNKIFLYTSGILIFFSFISIWIARSLGIMNFINSFSSIILDYSPIFLILIGITILINRKKNN